MGYCFYLVMSHIFSSYFHIRMTVFYILRFLYKTLWVTRKLNRRLTTLVTVVISRTERRKTVLIKMFAPAWVFFVLVQMDLTKTYDNYLGKNPALSDTHGLQSYFQLI